jgi:hypothetical protein
MKSLYNYIFESREILTTSNKQRRKELEKWLKHKKYDDYVETLNKMLEDPKTKTLLEDGFGGELGDTKLKFSVQEIPTVQLMPSQSEIDLDKSLKHALTKEDSVIKTFVNPIVINKPIVTFRKNYIIDGHHTWLQAVTLNPDGKILAFNYDGDISPIQMLKAVQGTIAAVKADDNSNNGKLPSNDINGPNFFDEEFDEKKIRKYIKDTFDDSLIDVYCKYIPKLSSKKLTIQIKEDIINYLVERLLDIKANNYPFESAPSRDDMPQVFKAGTDKDDKSSAYPNKKGSALNKLKDDKFMKSVTK